MSETNFSSLPLKDGLLENLASLKYFEMTPIQAQSLPHILEGTDVIAQGKTGSGKTAAFGLGLLQNLNVKRFRIQTLVLCPTRELAEQVSIEVRRLARSIHNIKVLTLTGGVPIGPQIGSLEHGAHIIIGTPGRVDDHLRKGTLHLEEVNTLVLDEADRMLDMGFQDTIDAIIDEVPEDRQTLLFSATFPDEIQSIAECVMYDPVMIKVEATHDNDSIEQTFYRVENSHEDRVNAVRRLLLEYRPTSSLVFCNTKKEATAVSKALRGHGFSALGLHGDLEQKERDQTLVRFANNSASVLVATDVAARGLDIDALDAVINFEIPRELEVHVHRIGRTGRAGKKGIACTLYSDKEDYKFDALEEYLSQSFTVAPLPPFELLKTPAYKPPMVTLQIDGGKKQKLRPGDILGALTSKEGIEGKQVGKIQVSDRWAFVAINREVSRTALYKITQGKMKGRSFKARILE